MMGQVTQELLNRIRAQVDHAGTVVWYDPGRDYAELAAALTVGELGCDHLVCYSAETGFLALRHDLETIWGYRETPPRLVLYVPLARQDAQSALIEYEAAGVVMRPGQQPPEQDTALEAIAQTALSRVLPPAAVTKIVGQVQARQLTLAELDRVAERGAEAKTGALAMIFDTGNAHEIALRFLIGDAFDGEIEKRSALTALRQLLSDTLGVSLAGDGPQELRALTARNVLMTDYLSALRERAPQDYAALPLAGEEVARQAAVKLATDWRNRRDGAQSYVQWSARVADEMSVPTNDLPLEALRQTETFLCSEQRMLGLVEEALPAASQPAFARPDPATHPGFWASQPDIKKHWEVVASAADILAERCASRASRARAGMQTRCCRAMPTAMNPGADGQRPAPSGTGLPPV